MIFYFQVFRLKCINLVFLMHATYLAQLIILDLIALIFPEEFRVWRSSLCNFLHAPTRSSVLRPNTVLSTLFSKIRVPYCLLGVRDQVHIHTKLQVILCILFFNIQMGHGNFKVFVTHTMKVAKYADVTTESCDASRDLLCVWSLRKKNILLHYNVCWL
jgi:hypothetical protein